MYKTEESLGENVNSLMITHLFTILKSNQNTDYQINKLILNIISAFALNDDLNIMIRMNWLENLISTLIDYTYKRRETNDDTEMHQILTIQTLLARILRLIFSLEKNRKYFKHLFPTIILTQFIDIGNYKHSLNLYASFVQEFNYLSDDDLQEISLKSLNITNPKENESQTIGGYTILELIVFI